MTNGHNYFYTGSVNYRKNNKKTIVLTSIGLLIFFFILGLAGKNDLTSLQAENGLYEQFHCITYQGKESCTSMGIHSDAWKKCSLYYELPCTEQGELVTHFTKQEAQIYYEADMRGDSKLTEFEVNYLIDHTDK